MARDLMCHGCPLAPSQHYFAPSDRDVGIRPSGRAVPTAMCCSRHVVPPSEGDSMHPVMRTVLVACILSALIWLADVLVGGWLALLVGLVGLTLYGVCLCKMSF